MISLISISSANSRKFFVDVYTGHSVCSFEFYDLDSALFVVEAFVVKAQTISVYSYILNPYNYGNQNIFQGKCKTYLAGLIPLRYRRLRGCYLPKNYKSLSYCRASRQYRRDFSERKSGRYYHRRSRPRESKIKK